MSLAMKVAVRYLYAQSQEKFVGKNARLKWSQYEWVLEELPQKGKKKLRRSTLRNPTYSGMLDWWIPGNILRFAKLTASDDYDAIKKKISEAYEEAHETTMKKGKPHDQEYLAKNDWVKKLEWYEEDVFYLKVTPEGTEAFTAEGKDFSVKTSWTEFSAYSPDSDFQQSDPHYTKYVSKSPTAARKFYLLLKTNPNALKGISWSAFGDWLGKQKIPYDTRFSSWS